MSREADRRSMSPNGSSDDDTDFPLCIPDFVRAWSKSVRRPTKLPDPCTYHEAIEPQAIFELDEEQEDGSLKTIFVVASRCEWCSRIAQACSRARPACARCRKRGTPCKMRLTGYDTLPGPKQSKPRKAKKDRLSHDSEIESNRHDSQEPSSSQSLLPRRTRATGATSKKFPKGSSGQKKVTNKTSFSKRAPSPEATVVVPRKRVRSNKETSHTSPQAEKPATSTENRNPIPKWSFVKRFDKKDVDFVMHNSSMVISESFTGTPRAWTNSEAELFMVFPGLKERPSGLSWLQSETPVLVLDHCRPEDMWTGPTTLTLTMTWDFSCELSAVDNPDQAMISGSEGSAGGYPLVDSSQGSSVSAITPTEVTTTSQGASGSTQIGGDTAISDQISSNPFLPPVEHTNHPFLSPTASIPDMKPEEIHILLDSRAYLVPVLIWSSPECRLTPGTPSPEYAYSCLGFFFVSDLREDLMDHNVDTVSGTMHGRVRWHIDLEWAPGGEEFLLSDIVPDNTPSDMIVDGQIQSTQRGDLSRPWWFDAPSNKGSNEGTEVPPQYRPRDLRMHYYSYLPLDLLAGFHPSENFPRGWFCTQCGMINAQKLFRHQMCQSSTCKARSDESVRQGKADPLWKLRSPHRHSKLVHPTNSVPSFLEYEHGSWDDGMQYWTYLINDNVSVQHVFTGNQDFLQVEATKLLEDIQRDVLLWREDSSSPYFTHVSTLLNSIDPSTPQPQVPIDTPSCICIAYHCLLDFAERYGEMDQVSFTRVAVQAWATSGSRRGKVFHAKTSPVVILCLGAEVILNFVPIAGYGNLPKAPMADTSINTSDGQDVNPVEILPECPKDETPTASGGSEPIAGTSSQNGDGVNTAGEINQVSHQKRHSIDAGHPDMGTSTPLLCNETEITASVDTIVDVSKRDRGRKKGKAKQSDPKISMTLVHGDCAILKGDDYECQIVRTGTTILVIGSEEPS